MEYNKKQKSTKNDQKDNKKVNRKSDLDEKYTTQKFSTSKAKNSARSKEKIYFDNNLKIKGHNKFEVRKNLVRGMKNIMSYQYNSETKHYNNMIIDTLICNKNCHLVSLFKDYMINDFIDEFLKRYYKKLESLERVPKIANYYKNYLKFFCNPVFMCFDINGIIQGYGDNKAEVYYKNNYGQKAKPKSKTKDDFDKDKLFSTTVKDNIDHNSMTKTEINIDNSSVMMIDNSRPFKEEDSEIFRLNHSQLSNKSGLITRRSQGDSFIFSLLVNLDNNQILPVNNYELMTRNKPKVIEQLNSNFEPIKQINKKSNSLTKNQNLIVNERENNIHLNRNYNITQVEKLMKEIDLKPKKPELNRNKESSISNSNQFKTQVKKPNSNNSNSQFEDSLKEKKTIVTSLKSTIKNEKGSEFKLMEDKQTTRNVKSPENFLTKAKSPDTKSPLTSNQTRLNEFSNIKLSKQTKEQPQNKNVYSVDNLTNNLKSNSKISFQNDLNVKAVKSIDLTNNIQTNYKIANSKSPHNHNRNHVKSPVFDVDKKIENKYNNYLQNSGLKTANLNYKNGNIPSNDATLNNLMKITLSLCVDKIGKNRPASSQIVKNYQSQVSQNQNAENLDSGRRILSRNENVNNINNFNININNEININSLTTNFKYPLPQSAFEPSSIQNSNLFKSKDNYSRNKQSNFMKNSNTGLSVGKSVTKDFDPKMYLTYNNPQNLIIETKKTEIKLNNKSNEYINYEKKNVSTHKYNNNSKNDYSKNTSSKDKSELKSSNHENKNSGKLNNPVNLKVKSNSHFDVKKLISTNNIDKGQKILNIYQSGLINNNNNYEKKGYKLK